MWHFRWALSSMKVWTRAVYIGGWQTMACGPSHLFLHGLQTKTGLPFKWPHFIWVYKSLHNTLDFISLPAKRKNLLFSPWRRSLSRLWFQSFQHHSLAQRLRQTLGKTVLYWIQLCKLQFWLWFNAIVHVPHMDYVSQADPWPPWINDTHGNFLEVSGQDLSNGITATMKPSTTTSQANTRGIGPRGLQGKGAPWPMQPYLWFSCQVN